MAMSSYPMVLVLYKKSVGRSNREVSPIYSLKLVELLGHHDKIAVSR